MDRKLPIARDFDTPVPARAGIGLKAQHDQDIIDCLPDHIG